MARTSIGWDIASAGLGLMSGGVGLIGFGAKKLFTDQNSSGLRHFTVGLLTTVLTGGTGLIPYMLALPGGTHREVQAQKQDIVNNRYQ